MSSEKVAIVTGGTRGLGKEICRHLADLGYRVVAVYSNNHNAATLFQVETGLPVYCWNVADANACLRGVDKVSADIGPCNVLVNNAGINMDAAVTRMAPDQWQAVQDTNIGGCFNMTRAVFPPMKASGGGRLIHIGSVVTSLGGIGIANYASSKAAIEGFSRAVASEGARFGITSNVVAPGYLDVGMARKLSGEMKERLCSVIPTGRFGAAADVAFAVGFLADERAGYITGACLPVNGGLAFS